MKPHADSIRTKDRAEVISSKAGLDTTHVRYSKAEGLIIKINYIAPLE